MARHKDTGELCQSLLCVTTYFCRNFVTSIFDCFADRLNYYNFVAEMIYTSTV